MTEFEKKQSGKIYDARDSELRSLQYRAKDLMREYNRIPAANENEKKRVLDMLVGAAGKNVRVNQPFYVDYGSNIFIGDNSFINLNCTLLDTGKITIGKNTLIGPDVKIYTAVHAKETSERFWEEDDGAVICENMDTACPHRGWGYGSAEARSCCREFCLAVFFRG